MQPDANAETATEAVSPVQVVKVRAQWNRDTDERCVCIEIFLSLVRDAARPATAPGVGFSSVQSEGVGRGSHPSIVAWGMIMLIRFSTFVSSGPWSLETKVNALPSAPIRAVRPTRWT